jgi:hypothetical protein
MPESMGPIVLAIRRTVWVFGLPAPAQESIMTDATRRPKTTHLFKILVFLIIIHSFRQFGFE